MAKFSLASLAAPPASDSGDRARRRLSLSGRNMLGTSGPYNTPLATSRNDDQPSGSRRTSISSVTTGTAYSDNPGMSSAPSTSSLADTESIQLDKNSPARGAPPISHQPASIEVVPWMIYEYPASPNSSSNRSVASRASSDSGQNQDGVRMVGRGGRGSRPQKPKTHGPSVSISINATPIAEDTRIKATPVDPAGRARMVGRGGSGSKPRSIADISSNGASSVSSSSSSLASPKFPPPTRKGSVSSMPSIPEPSLAPSVSQPSAIPVKTKVRVGGGRGGAGSKPRAVKVKSVTDPSSNNMTSALPKWLSKGKVKVPTTRDHAAPLSPALVVPAIKPVPPSPASFNRSFDSSYDSQSILSADSDSICFASPSPPPLITRAIRPLPPPPSSLDEYAEPSPSIYTIESESELELEPPPVALRNNSKLARTLGERPPPISMGIRRPALPSIPSKTVSAQASYNDAPLDLDVADLLSSKDNRLSTMTERESRPYLDDRFSMISTASTIIFSDVAVASPNPAPKTWEDDESGNVTPTASGRPGSPFDIPRVDQPQPFQFTSNDKAQVHWDSQEWSGEWNHDIHDVMNQLRDLR